MDITISVLAVSAAVFLCSTIFFALQVQYLKRVLEANKEYLKVLENESLPLWREISHKSAARLQESMQREEELLRILGKGGSEKKY